MKNRTIPRQFYMLSVLLLLWFCSFSFFDSADQYGWAGNIFLAQTIAVIACNIISREWWSWAVIIIEGVCAAYTSTVLLRWGDSGDIFYTYHHAFMLVCFIIELSIITLSTGGDSVRIVCRRILSAANNALRLFSAVRLHYFGGEVAN